MAIASIKIDFICGCTIEEACKKAIDIATKLDINVDCEFNDVNMIIFPNADLQDTLINYWVSQRSKDKHKIAVGFPSYEEDK